MRGLLRQKVNRSSLVPSLFIFLALMGTVWVCITLNQQLKVMEERVASLEMLMDEVASEEVSLFFLKQTPTDFFLSPEKRRISRRGSFYENLLIELVKGPSNETLMPTLPLSTKVIKIQLKGDIAHVDLGDVIGHLNVGARGEAITIFSIVNTLAQFPEINRVQLLLDGKYIESLAGHMSILEPLEADWTLVDW